MSAKLKRCKKIKKERGFTLIELLAVIVILAIIALIAVPVVMNIIGKANKSAFKDSAYALIKAGDLLYSTNEMEGAELSRKTFIFPNDNEKLDVKGELPTGGVMKVYENGEIAIAVTKGKYCATKGIYDKEVTITENAENCGLKVFEIGDVLYFDPTLGENGLLCTKAEWNSNNDKNGKSGCMRWYVYASNESESKVILDHNTTNNVAWISGDDYVDNANCVDEPLYARVCNDQGAKTLEKQLMEDTKNWKVMADIITLEDVMKLVPYYQKLSEADKNLFLNPIEENNSVISAYFDAIDDAWGDENMPEENTPEDWIARLNYFSENYSELVLPKYMYKNIIETCGDYECETEGYWIKTPFSHGLYSRYAWQVYINGNVNIQQVDARVDGIRPVITLSK